MTVIKPTKAREEVQSALDQTGTVTGAARLLGVSRQTVHVYIRHYGITEWRRPAKRAA